MQYIDTHKTGLGRARQALRTFARAIMNFIKELLGRFPLKGHRRRPQHSVFVNIEQLFSVPWKWIGSGGFGSVWKVKYRGEDVAVKVIDSISPTDGMRKALQNELDLLSRMPPHENVVALLGGSMESPYCCIVEELCDTDLHHVIHPNGAGTKKGPPPKPMPIEQVLQVGLNVARGLAHLHLKVIHRDVKPGNILMKNGVAKVADFGLSILKEKSYMSGDGTAGYMSPESLKNRVNHKSDVYSLGILLWECITGLTPFQDYDNKLAVMYAVDKGKRPDFPASANCPPALRTLVESCWHQDHRSRPECAEIICELEKIKMCLFGN